MSAVMPMGGTSYEVHLVIHGDDANNNAECLTEVTQEGHAELAGE